jgi:transposase
VLEFEKILSKNSEPIQDRLIAQVEKVSSGCWEWRGHVGVQGYGRIKARKFDWRAHRLSWCVFKGPIPDGIDVLHHCDNKLCINPDHLFLGGQQDNTDDYFTKNPPKGSRSTYKQEYKAHEKVTHQDLLDRSSKMREWVEEGFTIHEIAEHLKVSYYTVWSACKKLGIPAKKRGRVPYSNHRPPEGWAIEALHMLESGSKLREVAARFGVPISSVVYRTGFRKYKHTMSRVSAITEPPQTFSNCIDAPPVLQVKLEMPPAPPVEEEVEPELHEPRVVADPDLDQTWRPAKRR